MCGCWTKLCGSEEPGWAVERQDCVAHRRAAEAAWMDEWMDGDADIHTHHMRLSLASLAPTVI